MKEYKHNYEPIDELLERIEDNSDLYRLGYEIGGWEWKYEKYYKLIKKDWKYGFIFDFYMEDDESYTFKMEQIFNEKRKVLEIINDRAEDGVHKCLLNGKEIDLDEAYYTSLEIIETALEHAGITTEDSTGPFLAPYWSLFGQIETKSL